MPGQRHHCRGAGWAGSISPAPRPLAYRDHVGICCWSGSGTDTRPARWHSPWLPPGGPLVSLCPRGQRGTRPVEATAAGQGLAVVTAIPAVPHFVVNPRPTSASPGPGLMPPGPLSSPGAPRARNGCITRSGPNNTTTPPQIPQRSDALPHRQQVEGLRGEGRVGRSRSPHLPPGGAVTAESAFRSAGVAAWWG